MNVAVLPHVNAAINTCVAIILIVGLLLIKRGRREAHRNAMTAALGLSALFLVSYITYHYLHGSTKFTGQGWIRPVYFAILLSHTVLAVVNLPLIIVTVLRAWRGDFDKHKKVAKWTWMIWIYVAITGPLVYLLLYQIYPSDHGAAAFELAQKQHREGGRDTAIESYRKSAGEGHVGAGCYAAMIEISETASTSEPLMKKLAAFPDDVHCVTLLGREYVYASRYDEAKPVLERAIRMAPESDFPHASLAFLHFKKYDYKEAAAAFKAAMKADPTSAMYVYNAGYAHYLHGGYAEAAPLLQRAIEMGLPHETAERAQQDLDVINGAIWVCPMHNHERGKKGDVCGVCKMNLEPVARGLSDKDLE